MKKKIQKMIAIVLAALCMVSAFSPVCFALEWDGSSGGGAGRGKSADVAGFAVRYYPDDNCLGYRFSIVDKTGANKVSKVIDVFRDTYYGKIECTNAYKFNTKYNKKQLITYQNSGFSTGKVSTNCYKEADMGFATALGAPPTMKTWQANNNNLNKILSTLGAGSISTLKNGDKVLVEPLYDVMIQGTYHSVTATELALYGKYYLGENSDGGSSSTASSWGFISVCTNKLYPNLLFTPDGQGLWPAASELTKRETFKTIINNGYGVGIGYTETKPDFSPSLSVKQCEAYAGSKGSKTTKYGTSTGNSFATWTYGSDYPYSGATIWYSVNFPAESQNCYVQQTVSVIGGGSTSRKVYTDNGTWFDVALSPTTVPNDKSYIQVKAKEDWIDANGNVLKYGTEKTFYIPIKPTVYRYQVSAIDYSGNVQAYNGSEGTSGKVYVGQKVYAQYKFTSKNTWVSANDLYAAMHKWGGGDWVRVAGTDQTDLTALRTSLSSSISQNLNSSLGYVRVPDNSGSGNNVMRFKMTSEWSSDDVHTSESTWIDIPIVKPDVELYDMYLVNSSGVIVDRSALTVGETLNIRHVYKNNTSCPVFVCGYDQNQTQIPGVYRIPANGTITVDAGTLTVPNKRSFSFWGGVFLEGAGIRNTDWETNGTNNCWLLFCQSDHPVTLVPITPNASYRENTDVITSYRVYNASLDDYIPSNNLQVRFNVTKTDGSKIYTQTKPVVVAAKGNNLIYFKWRVPSGLNKANVVVMAEILDSGTAYNLRSNTRSTVPYTYYTTPDTEYEEKAPAGFRVPAAPTISQNYATWTEYAYESGAFVAKNYAIGIPASSTAKLTPAEGNSAAKNASGNWTMKSGYGVWLEANNLLLNVSGYLPPSSDACTAAQYAYALYPEYGYQFGMNKCTTLYLNGSQWCFNKLNAQKNNKAYHYTPLYFPDGQYVIKVVKSDMWTPSGMIQSVDTTKPITISGNAYDDWYITR